MKTTRRATAEFTEEPTGCEGSGSVNCLDLTEWPVARMPPQHSHTHTFLPTSVKHKNKTNKNEKNLGWTMDTITTLLCVISFWEWTLPGSDTPCNVKAKGCDSVLKQKSCPEATFNFSEGFKWGILQMCCGTMFPWTCSLRQHRPLTSSFTKSVSGGSALVCVPVGCTFQHKGKMTPRVEAQWLVTQTEASQKSHLDLSSLCLVFILSYLILIRPLVDSLLFISEGLVSG